MTQLEYWKQRCEALEAYTGVTSVEIDISYQQAEQFKKWQKLKRDGPPAPVEGEEYPISNVVFFTRKNGEYVTENGKRVTIDFIMNNNHYIHDDYGYVILPEVSRWRGEQGSVVSVSENTPCGARWVTISTKNLPPNLPPEGKEVLFDGDELTPPIWGYIRKRGEFYYLVVHDSSGEEELIDPLDYTQWLDESPCPCQSLPSREAIENALYATRKFLTTEASDLADDILMYLKDYGVSVSKYPTRSEVNEWCNAHSSLIAANPMYAIRKFYNWIFDNKK
jgi:hypothetical protein